MAAVKDYRSLGKLATHHEHWDIDETGAEAGARVVETILDRLPVATASRALGYVLALRAASVGYAVFALPVVQSIRLAKEEAARAEAAARPKQPGAPTTVVDGAAPAAGANGAA